MAGRDEVEYLCDCGRTLKVKRKNLGSILKCHACGRKVRLCPDCFCPMHESATFCVECGFDLAKGKRASAAKEAVPRDGRTRALLSDGLKIAAVVALCVLLWVCGRRIGKPVETSHPEGAMSEQPGAREASRAAPGNSWRELMAGLVERVRKEEPDRQLRKGICYEMERRDVPIRIKAEPLRITRDSRSTKISGISIFPPKRAGAQLPRWTDIREMSIDALGHFMKDQWTVRYVRDDGTTQCTLVFYVGSKKRRLEAQVRKGDTIPFLYYLGSDGSPVYAVVQEASPDVRFAEAPGVEAFWVGKERHFGFGPYVVSKGRLRTILGEYYVQDGYAVWRCMPELQIESRPGQREGTVLRNFVIKTKVLTGKRAAASNRSLLAEYDRATTEKLSREDAAVIGSFPSVSVADDGTAAATMHLSASGSYVEPEAVGATFLDLTAGREKVGTALLVKENGTERRCFLREVVIPVSKSMSHVKSGLFEVTKIRGRTCEVPVCGKGKWILDCGQAGDTTSMSPVIGSVTAAIEVRKRGRFECRWKDGELYMAMLPGSEISCTAVHSGRRGVPEGTRRIETMKRDGSVEVVQRFAYGQEEREGQEEDQKPEQEEVQRSDGQEQLEQAQE